MVGEVDSTVGDRGGGEEGEEGEEEGGEVVVVWLWLWLWPS